MLTSEEIKQRIIKLEGQQTAFKLTLEEKGATDSVKKSLVAFSNDYHQLGGGVIIYGTLKQQIESAVQLVERYTIQGYQFSNDSPIRKDTVEYPLRAIREVVANAIVHRDYEYPNASVSLEMFDDRIEVRSPGGLFGIVSRENFGTGINDYRNPTLAVGLNIQGLVEKAGTGIFTD